MQHVVFWSSPSGPAFERVPALDEAVELVQRLRNDHDIIDAEVHALTAVPLSFRTVVVVEAAPGGIQPPPASPVHPLDQYAGELTPLSVDVPGVVPDQVGPFNSLAVLEVVTEAAADVNVAGPHLVALPSVAPDDLEATDDDPSLPALHALAEAVALAESERVPSYEPAAEEPVRSLGLFA